MGYTYLFKSSYKHQDGLGCAKDLFEEKAMKGGKDRSSSDKQGEFLDQMQVWQLNIEGDKKEGWLNRRSCRLQHNSEKFSISLDGKSQSKECIFENSFVRQKQCSLFSAMQNHCLGAAQGEIYPVCECCDGFKILASGVSKPIHCSQCIWRDIWAIHIHDCYIRHENSWESVKNCCCGEWEVAQ